MLWADPTLAGQDAEVFLLRSKSLSPLSEASGPISHSPLLRGQCSVQESWWVPGPALFLATKRPKVRSHCQASAVQGRGPRPAPTSS